MGHQFGYVPVSIDRCIYLFNSTERKRGIGGEYQNWKISPLIHLPLFLPRHFSFANILFSL